MRIGFVALHPGRRLRAERMASQNARDDLADVRALVEELLEARAMAPSHERERRLDAVIGALERFTKRGAL